MFECDNVHPNTGERNAHFVEALEMKGKTQQVNHEALTVSEGSNVGVRNRERKYNVRSYNWS